MKKGLLILMSLLLLVLPACKADDHAAQMSSDKIEAVQLHASKETYKSIDQLIENSQNIVIGQVTVVDSYLVDDPNLRFNYYNTLSSVQTTEWLLGEQKLESISLKQMGAPDQQEPEPKVKAGSTYILFLSDETPGAKAGYWATNLCDGVFEIVGGKVYSYSDNPVMQAYNGKTLEEFTALVREKIK